MKHVFLCTGLLLLAQLAWAQPGTNDPDWSRNKGKAFLFHFNLGTHLPAGDLSKRFGRDQSIGGGAEIIGAGNVIYGLTGHYFFGQKVKEDPIAGLRTPDGDIIGSDQALATVALRERGLYIGANAGKLFVRNQHQRAGIRLTGSAGWMQHKIRIQDDTGTAAQLNGEYIKGYDRLTGGFCLQQFIGWQQLGATRRFNWYAGFEFGQGFTQSLRSWDFAENRFLDDRRLDLRFGIRAGWTLPFYAKGAERIYY